MKNRSNQIGHDGSATVKLQWRPLHGCLERETKRSSSGLLILFMHLRNSSVKRSVSSIQRLISLYVGASLLMTCPFLGTMDGGPSLGKVQKPCTRAFLPWLIFSSSFIAFLSCFKVSGCGFFVCTVRYKRFARLVRGRSSVRILPHPVLIPSKDQRFISRMKWTKLSLMTKIPTACSSNGCRGIKSNAGGILSKGLFCGGFFMGESLTSRPDGRIVCGLHIRTKALARG